MKVYSFGRGVVTKNLSDCADFTVCILSLGPTVPSSNSKSSVNFGLGSLGYLVHFSTFLTFYLLVKFFLSLT